MARFRGTKFRGPVGWGEGAYKSLTAAYAVDPQNDNGMVFGLNLAGGFTVTLPPIAKAGPGFRCAFRVETAPTTAYIITENGTYDTDKVNSQINELETDTGDDGPRNAAHTFVNFVANVAVVGDRIDVECNGTTWFVRGQTNADGGITLT